MRIDHVADDAKLGKTVDQYNDRIEQHAATAVDIARPPNIPDDECATISVGTIATHAAGLESERLKHAQDAVVLARQRVELLEAIAVETKARADQADSCLLPDRRLGLTVGVFSQPVDVEDPLVDRGYMDADPVLRQSLRQPLPCNVLLAREDLPCQQNPRRHPELLFPRYRRETSCSFPQCGPESAPP